MILTQFVIHIYDHSEVTCHWETRLQVPERIIFRLVVLVYHCLHSMTPAYLSANLLHVSDISLWQ